MRRSFALFSIFAFVALAQAAEPRIGRLPDGRAYRISPEGYRLVDELAELEVTNDELHRQMITLESEIDEQKTEIRKLRAARTTVQPQLPDSFEQPETPSCEDSLRSMKREREDLISRLAKAEGQLAAARPGVATRSKLAERLPPAAGLQTTLLKRLNEIREELKLRDRLYVELKQRKKGVEVHLKDPKSNSGKSVDQLAREVRDNRLSPDQLSELEQIDRQIQDDIVLIQRLGTL